MAELLPLVRQRFFSASGVPLAGGKLFSYEAGTTTPKTTYTDRAALSPNTNPIILDANGECDVWINSGYFKFILKDSTDVIQWTKDQVSLASEAALASAFWRDVVYISTTDSPFAITSAHNGKLISVDSTAGAVAINLPEISGLVLPYNVGVKVNTLVGAVTITRFGTDTIEGSATKVLSSLNAGAQLIADIDKSPDQWTTLDIGTVADGAISRAKLASGAVATKNKRTVTADTTVLTTDDELYVTATCTITLLAANNTGARPIQISNVNASTITTILCAGSDTALGAASNTLPGQYSSVLVSPDGSSKYTIS